MKKTNQLLEHIYSRFIIYIPSVALVILGFQLLIVFWTDPMSTQLNARIVTALKMSSTLAALSFYAGYMTIKEHKKPFFYLNGERFFHVAVILFSINILQKLLGFEVTLITNNLAISISQLIINIIASVFIIYATTLMSTALHSLLNILHLEVKQRIHD
jgi:hypothetical protein